MNTLKSIPKSIKILSLLIKRVIQKEPNLQGIPKEQSKNLAHIFPQFLNLHRKNLNNGYLFKAKSVINKWERSFFFFLHGFYWNIISIVHELFRKVKDLQLHLHHSVKRSRIRLRDSRVYVLSLDFEFHV